MSRRQPGPIVAVCLVLAACNDASHRAVTGPSAQSESKGRAFGQRFYVIGTSVSAGTCSGGNLGSCQANSWVAQLIRALHREPVLPLISAPGCKAPHASPIIGFKRTSGEPVPVRDAAAQCSPNEPGVDLNTTQNLAVDGALTGEALATAPEAVTNPLRAQLYRRVLPLGLSQVSALELRGPRFVSIELGVNDILGVHSGAVIPGVTYVPFAVWAGQYNRVLDRVGAVTKEALLVGLGRDISRLSSLRYGYELWADRAAFLSAFHVDVNVNCDANQNLIVVPAIVPVAVAQGLGRKAAGAPPFILSCAEGPSMTEDRVLTPTEAAAANAQFARMTDHIRAQAEARGYAYMELESLYGLPKPPFSVVNLMTSGTPYGPNIGLDGLHPSAAGHTILAQTALRAINDRYNVGIDNVFSRISTSPSIRSP